MLDNGDMERSTLIAKDPLWLQSTVVSVLVLIFSAKVIHLKLVSGGKDFIWPTAVFGRAVGTPVGTGKPATHGSS